MKPSRTFLVAIVAVAAALFALSSLPASARAADDPVEARAVFRIVTDAIAHDPDAGLLAKTLPTLTREDFAPIGEARYRYGLSGLSVGLEESATADAARDITSLSEHASSEDSIQRLIRDCSRDALSKTAWDLWWSWANEDSSFQPEEELKSAAEGCLAAYIKRAPASEREAVVKAFVEYVTTGAKIVSEQMNDSSNYADWLQVLGSVIEP